MSATYSIFNSSNYSNIKEPYVREILFTFGRKGLYSIRHVPIDFVMRKKKSKGKVGSIILSQEVGGGGRNRIVNDI